MALTIVLEGQANLGVTTGVPATITLQLGTPGPAGTIVVGSTTTSAPGSDASVVNVGTLSNAVLDFTIPRGIQGPQGVQGVQGIQGQKGDKGDKGDTGNTGSAGVSATITAGTTTTGAPGSSASVTNVGSTTAAVFNFAIPRGDVGATGAKGDKGDTGAGVATGGAAGQVLAKINGTNFNTHWITPLTGNFLPMAGGTMGTNASVVFPNIGGSLEITNKHVKQTEDDPDTSSFGGFEITKNFVTGNVDDENNWSLGKGGVFCNDGSITFGLTKGGTSGEDWSLNASGVSGVATISGEDYNWSFNGRGAATYGQVNIAYDNYQAQVASGYFYAYQTNTGTNPSAYGVVYTGGFEAGDGAGQWIEFTPTQLRFGDGTIQTTAATGGSGSYLPLAGGLMSGAITFDAVGGQNINKGSFDSGRGGYNGISLNCAVGYELNWQAGYLKAINSSNAVVPINVDNSDLTLIKTIPADIDYPEYTTTTTLTGIGILNSFTIPDNWSAGWGIGQDGVGGYGANSGVNTWQCGSAGVSGYDGTSNWGFGVTGITFPDSTVQTTAAVNPAGTYLPLAGGTMDQNVAIYFNWTNLDDIAAVLSVQGDQIAITNTISNNSIRFNSDVLTAFNATGYTSTFSGNECSVAGGLILLNSEGVKFPDGTTQSTAAGAGAFLPLAGGTMTGNIVLTDSSEYKLQGSGNDGGDNSWIFSFGNNMTDFQPELLLSYNTIDHGNNHVKTTYNKIEIYGEDTDAGSSSTVNLFSSRLTFTDNAASTSATYSATGITFPDLTTQTTAASDWKAGGIAMFTVPGDEGRDNSCSYSLNFNGGDELLTLRLKAERDGSCMELYTTSDDEHGIRFYNYSNTLLNTLFNKNGVTFPDGSSQTTAAVVGEAPIDGNAYVRKNGAWVDITTL